MLKRWSAIWLCCTVPLAPHHSPLLPVTVPSFPSLSPPFNHCPLLPITVPSYLSLFPPPHYCSLLPITVPSFSSLSPPSHHCPLLPITVPSFPSLSPPSHHCPLLPITVSLLPILLSPLSHHCPLLPTTVPSSPSLSPPPHHCPLLPITSCYHGRLFFPPLLSRYSLLLPIWSVKKNSLSVSEVYIPRWSASSSGSRLSGDHLVWARDWTHLDEQCGMDCRQPPSR